MVFEIFHEKIESFSKEWNLTKFKTIYREKDKDLKEKIDQAKSINDDLRNNLNELIKMQEKIQVDIDIIKTKTTKKHQQETTTRTDIFMSAKKIVELEQKVLELETLFNESQHIKKEIEDEVEKLNAPTIDILVYVFMQGFGINIVQKNDTLHMQIKNEKEMNVYTINLDDDNINKIREEIWAHI